MYDLKERVLLSGDTPAYKELSFALTFHKMDPWDLLFYAQLMCNKYNFPSACLDCYIIDSERLAPENLKSHDSVTNKLGNYYLLKAYKLGDSRAREFAEETFKKEIPSLDPCLKEALDSN